MCLLGVGRGKTSTLCSFTFVSYLPRTVSEQYRLRVFGNELLCTMFEFNEAVEESGYCTKAIRVSSVG
jgi:hypothetical protein